MAAHWANVHLVFSCGVTATFMNQDKVVAKVLIMFWQK